MAKFRSSARQGEFRPLRVNDETQKIQQQTNRKLNQMQQDRKFHEGNMQAYGNYMQAQGNLDLKTLQRDFQIKSKQIELDRDQFNTNYAAESQKIQREQAAERQTLEMISSLSGAALEATQGYLKQDETNKQNAYTEGVQAFGLTFGEATALQKIDFSMAQSDLENQEIIKQLSSRGASISELQRLQGLGAGRYTDNVSLLLNSAANTSAFVESRYDTPYQITTPEGNVITTTYNEQNGPGGNVQLRSLVKRQINSEIIREEYGNVNPQLYGKYVAPQVNRYWSAEDTRYSNAERKRVQADAEQQTYTVFNNAYRGSNGNLDTAFQLVEQTQGRNRTVQRDNFLKFLQAKIKTDDSFDPETARTFLEEKQVCINGDCKSLLDRYGGTDEMQSTITDIDNEIKARRSAATQAETARKREAQNLARDMRRAVMDSGRAMTDAEKGLLIDEFNQRTGNNYPEVADTFFGELPTVQTQATDTQNAQMQRLAETFQLTPEAVMSTNNQEIIDKWLPKAQTQQKSREASGYDAKIYEKRFEDLAKSPSEVEASKGLFGGKYNVSVDQKKYQLLEEFNRRVATLTLGGKSASDAAEQAWAEISTRFTNDYIKSDNKAAKFKDGGYRDIIEANETAAGNAEKFQAKAEYVTNLMQAYSDDLSYVLDKPYLYSRSELEQAIEGYGKPGWTPGPIAEFVSQRMGGRVSPFEVLNRSLAAHEGFEPLEEPPSIALANTEIRPGFRELLQQFPTPERSTRAMSSIGAFRPELIPNGYGEFIEQSASTYGVDPTQIAALAEIESGFQPGAVSRTGAVGVMQIQPDAHPLYNGGYDPAANIDYGTQYYSQLLQQFGDPVVAAGAYNAGPGRMMEHVEQGRPLPAETVEHMRKFSIALAKYGDVAQLSSPMTMRENMAVYTTGNIGPTSTGPHLDVKQVGRGRFSYDALDNYVEVDDPEFGRISLGDLRERTGFVGDSFDQHTARGSHGIDYGTHSGTKVYLKNGAKVIGTTPSEHGDVLTIELPNGQQYTFLHGTSN